jgi:hypothetical protein
MCYKNAEIDCHFLDFTLRKTDHKLKKPKREGRRFDLLTRKEISRNMSHRQGRGSKVLANCVT